MARLSTMTHRAMKRAALQFSNNCWIRGMTANGFFYLEVEMLRSQWIALKYCMQYDRLSQQ